MAALGSALLSSLGLTQAERAFRPWWDAIEDHIVYTIIILVRTNLIFSICCCCSPDINTIISSDRSSCTDDGLLYIYPKQQPTFSDLEHLCLSILLQVSL